MAKRSVVVSQSKILGIDRKIASLDKRMTLWQRQREKLVATREAMRTILGASLNGRAGTKPEKPAPAAHQLRPSEEMAASDSATTVPQAVRDSLQKTSMTARELRDAVLRAGVKREKLGATYSYLYTVIGRGLARGEIIRRGDKYSLAAETGPNEEDLKP